MKEKFEEQKPNLSPIEHHEWEGMHVDEVVAVKGYEGLYRIDRIFPDRGVAILKEVDEHGKDINETKLEARLDFITKEFA